MIFQNIELHNVSEVCKNPNGDGYLLLRAPQTVADQLSDMGRRQNDDGTGIELRFEITGDDGVDIDLRLLSPDPEPTARIIPVYWPYRAAPVHHASRALWRRLHRHRLALVRRAGQLDI